VSAIIASSILVVLFVILWFAPKITSFWAVLGIAVHLTFTVAVVLAASAVTVFLRDLRHAIPILMQFGLLATPIFYSIDAIPSEWQIPYVIVNPMAAVITTYRDTILLGQGPPWRLLLPAAAASVLMLYGAMRLFRRLELGFADVA
jgi:ABC-type polysaccharide/polyol phosphate export permease